MSNPEALATARRLLSSPTKEIREQAEATLLAARDDAVPYLTEALNDDDGIGPSPVPRAALLLCALKARAALPALYAVVAKGPRPGRSDDDLAFVARALAELLEGQDAFDDRARAALEKLAASRDRSTRAFAAQAYGSLGDLRSKARVQALARDSDPWVREKASAVLARLQETEALAQHEPIDFAALIDKTQAEGGALRPYLDDLGDIRRPVRANAVAALVRAGKGAVPLLLDKLNQPYTRARIGAATALGQLQSTEAAGPLLIAATAPASTPEEQELRATALRSLAGCLTGMEEGLAASILPLAADPDRFVRAAALLCLGRLADRQGLKAIIASIMEDDPFVVESAAVALSEGAREGDVDIVLPLLAALDKRAALQGRGDGAVKEAILVALSRVSIEAPALRVRVRQRVRREVAGAVASTRKAAVALLERLYDSEGGDAPPLPLLDDILARLHDDHPEVRIVAAAFVRAHLEPGMTGAVEALSRALRRGESTVSLLVLEALRRHDTSEAKAALETARSNDALSARAAELLVGFEPKTTTWRHVAKGRAAAAPSPPLSPRAESNRPAAAATPRVRSAAHAPPAPGEAQQPTDDEPRATVVEARFDK
jgi:HEAT repeat protein